MFGFLKSDPQKKLQKKYEQLLEQAMQFQRNGDIKSYSMTTAEAEKVREQIENLRNKSQS
ncbi:MAG: DUF6435 family protein [Cellvibrionaceae bacterium]